MNCLWPWQRELDVFCSFGLLRIPLGLSCGFLIRRLFGFHTLDGFGGALVRLRHGFGGFGDWFARLDSSHDEVLSFGCG
jgi:hypothetical protein